LTWPEKKGEIEKSKDKNRIRNGQIRIEIRKSKNQNLEIRRGQKDTCRSGRDAHSTRVTDDRGGSHVPGLAVIVAVREVWGVGEVRRLEDLVPLSLERRLEGLIPLLLTRLLTLIQT
jgi:hypothetical protein